MKELSEKLDYEKLTKKDLILLLKEKETIPRLKDSFKAFQRLKKYFNKDKELYIVLLLDSGLKIIKEEVITIGLKNKCLIHPREVFAPAIENRAISVIVAHNHPSGNLIPSLEDLNVFKCLNKAGNILGINVVDNIIFSDTAYFSVAEHIKSKNVSI